MLSLLCTIHALLEATHAQLVVLTETVDTLRAEVRAGQLGDDRPLSLRDVAEIYGCSERTVDRIHRSASEPLVLTKMAGGRFTTLGHLRRHQRAKMTLSTATSGDRKPRRLTTKKPTRR